MKISKSQQVIYVAIASNVAIGISKFVAAGVTGSSAMLSEGIHSLVDTGNELLLLLGVKRSKHPADEWHPFGYGKAMYFWAFMVALQVFSLGGGISLYHGIMGLKDPPPLGDPTWNYLVLAVAAICECLSWRVSHRALVGSDLSGGNLWRAVQSSPDATAFTVFMEDSVALIGIVLATLGIGLSHAFGNPYFDPAASIAIGLVLIGAAFVLGRRCSRLLVGESIDREQIVRIRKVIAAEPAVESVGNLLTMQLGPENTLLTAAVRFQRRLSPDEVEKAIGRLENAIRSQYPFVRHMYLESGALKASASSMPSPMRNITNPRTNEAGP